uniref:Nuclease associated modular domain-containing protein n=1 Tax=Rhizophora mucronata TaxID=61149 RepID=A0A2P2IH52_RHIMU
MGRFCVPHDHVPNALLWPTSSYAPEYTNLQLKKVLSNYHKSVMKSICTPFTSISSIPRYHHAAVLQIGSVEGETSDFENHFQSKLVSNASEKHTMEEEIVKRTMDEEDKLDCYHGYSGSFSEHKVRGRRSRKHGNKGRIPWNKGLNHTAETRALIKQRTIEALRDPKVRKKMSEHPLAHR